MSVKPVVIQSFAILQGSKPPLLGGGFRQKVEGVLTDFIDHFAQLLRHMEAIEGDFPNHIW
jgi:hypothetical protein